MTKFSELDDTQLYRRGRDYPAFARTHRVPMCLASCAGCKHSVEAEKPDECRFSRKQGSVKMAIAMTGKEIKEWFTAAELKSYPKPDAYTGSLP